MSTSSVESTQHRGSFVKFHVFCRNLGPENVSSPGATVSSSDPTNVLIVGSNTRSWPNHRLAGDRTKYDLGEFAFSITQTAPDGSYVIRIEVTAGWQSTIVSESTEIQLFVGPSPAETSARKAAEEAERLRSEARQATEQAEQLRFTVMAVSGFVLVLIAALAAVLFLRRRPQSVFGKPQQSPVETAGGPSPSISTSICVSCGGEVKPLGATGKRICSKCNRLYE